MILNFLFGLSLQTSIFRFLHNFQISRATKGLPKDHVGDIRVITIENIDSNLCCGTHVRNLAQLQCIKILNAEKIKNRQFINFLVGGRVMNRLQECFSRECKLTTIFKYVRVIPFDVTS